MYLIFLFYLAILLTDFTILLYILMQFGKRKDYSLIVSAFHLPRATFLTSRIASRDFSENVPSSYMSRQKLNGIFLATASSTIEVKGKGDNPFFF